MLRNNLFRSLCWIVVSLGIMTLATAQSTDPGVIPGRILFMLSEVGKASDVAADLRNIDGIATNAIISKEVSAPMRIWELHFDHEVIPQQRMLDAVKAHRYVVLAQNDHPATFRAIPNDPGYANQWQHQNIDSEAAWDITTGGTTADGDEIVVCVIEAANLLHSDLVGNRWVNDQEVPNNGIDDDANGYVDDHEGWNPGAGNDDNLFGGGHGTNVAGMIGAMGNNGAGVAGANWNVKIMVVTVGSLSQSNVIASYTYPLIQRRRYNNSNGTQGAFVVATNASWGIDNADPNNYPLWCAIYDTLGTEGILSCGATSNSNVNVDVVGDMPTACSSPFMVSVTATNSSDVRTFSGYGATTIDVGAPGESIYTTSGTTSGSTSNTFTSGTSFASPLTAGVIGLLYAAPCPSMIALAKADPEAGALYVRQKLFEGVEQVGNLPGQTVTGGRINVNNSMQLILADCGACVPPGGLGVTEISPTSVQLDWNGAQSDLFNLRYRVEGAALWTTIMNLSTTSYQLNGLATCGSYEYQVQRICSGSESTFSTSRSWTLSGCCTPVTVSIATDRWGAETTWSITNGSTVFASGGPYTNAATNGVYPRPSVVACLPDGCYDLVVNDSYGDGMCCAYGAGYVEVQDDGIVIASAASFTYQAISSFCVSSSIKVDLKAWLQGPYGSGPLMSDALRSAGLVPLVEPYGSLGWPGGGESTTAGVLAITGNDAIVDWVRVELRPSGSLTTVAAARNALLQRDGDVVDVDGTSSLSFTAAEGDYHIAIMHRNHLGCMTSNVIALSATPAVVDLRTGTTSTYGTDARYSNGSLRALWAGNASADDRLKYTGSENDRDPILQQIGGLIPTNLISGYHLTDVNLDGSVRYTGTGNDRDLILQNIGGTIPTLVRHQQLP